MPRAPNSAATSGLRADRRIRFGVLCRICAPKRTSVSVSRCATVSVSCCATVPVSRPIVRSVLPFLRAFRSCERPTDTGSANQLVRMSALYPARKPAIPSVGNTAHVRNSKPTCETASPRAEQQAHVRNSKPTCRTAGPRAGQQAHVQDSRPTCRTAGPRAGQQAHVQDSRPTCGTARSRAWGEGRHRYAAPALTLSSPLT